MNHQAVGTENQGTLGEARSAHAAWFAEAKLELPGVTLNVAQGPPNGPPLLCLHGVGRAWRDFAPLLPAFVPGWEVIVPDLRGHGASSRTPGQYLVRDYLSDVLELLGRLPQPAVIYGHSLGALLATLAAAECPDLVRAVVAEDPPGSEFLRRIQQTSYAPLFRGMQRLAGQGRDVGAIARKLGEIVLKTEADGQQRRLRDVRDAASLRFSARWLCDLDPTVYAPILEQHWPDGLGFPAVWSRVRCPTLLLAADEAAGGMLPAHEARSIAQQLADGTLIEFPQVGHQLHWLATEGTLRATLGFLGSL